MERGRSPSEILGIFAPQGIMGTALSEKMCKMRFLKRLKFLQPYEIRFNTLILLLQPSINPLVHDVVKESRISVFQFTRIDVNSLYCGIPEFLKSLTISSYFSTASLLTFIGGVFSLKRYPKVSICRRFRRSFRYRCQRRSHVRSGW